MKKRNLTFKFTLMFVAFTLVTLITTSFLSYLNQMQLYKSQREESIQCIANYLESRIIADNEDFLNMQKYMLANYKNILIPVDFTEKDIAANRHEFETLFTMQYPEKVLGEDIQFDELSDEIKRIYTIYNFEYYTVMFEQAVKDFNIAYAYYLIPTGEGEHMYWFLFNLRETMDVNGETGLLLCDDVNDLISKGHVCMWETWNTGKRPNGYDVFDNQYGKTYAYYTPLFINDEKLGVIGVEVEIAKVNHAILLATVRQVLTIAVVLIIFMLLLLTLIRSNYIRKLVRLRDSIEEYSKTKETEIAEVLTKEVTNSDEISTIMGKFAEMIYELERYMKTLSRTAMDLQNSRRQTIELNELAHKDALTGIRNKLGYDKEVQKIEWEIADGLKEFGVAMIDLNFLKRINDTYGHDKGNIAIIAVCKIVCHIFEHSPVFRVGGDEFVVILKGHDLEHIKELIAEFNKQLKERQENTELEYWEKTSAALGYAIYDPRIDNAYENVFRRADIEMYKAKKAMKAVRED